MTIGLASQVPQPTRKSALPALVWEFARTYPRRTAVIVASLLVAGLLEGVSVLAIFPLLSLADGAAASQSAAVQTLRRLFDAVGLTPSLPDLLAVIIGGMLLKAAVMLLAMRQVATSVAHVTADLRHRLIVALLAARWDFFSMRPAGSVATALSTEADWSGRAYESLCYMAALIVQTLIYFLITVFVSWPVALVGIAAGALVVLGMSRLIAWTREVGRQQTHVMQGAMARVTDGLRGMKPLKAMAREGRLESFLHDAVERLNRAASRGVFYRQTMSALLEPTIVVFLGVGIALAHEILHMPLGTQMMLALLFYRLVTRIGNIQQQRQIATLFESAYWSLRENIAAASAARDRGGTGAKPGLPATIVVDNVSFAYGAQPVLRNVDLALRPGEITTVIGASGSGKTTLADLLLGLRWTEQGTIRIGDMALRDIDLAFWRSHVGYVPQELFLFNATLAENVTLDDPAVGRDKVRAALQHAGAWEFVAQLPLGMDSRVGEGGILLSGGQRQRIAIARALVRDPALLILDEATTALDPETEAAICDTVRGLAHGRIILAITHQPAWISAAHHVYRLADGRLSPVNAPAQRAAV